jgi:AcrR family transcriptional regulator
LIADQGYAATSLRHIISEAGVNLAAVHYHFGSKEDLLDQVILQKASSVNAARLVLLDRLETAAAGAPLPVAQVLGAFFEPMIEAGSRSPQFVKLMGRMFAEGLLPTIVAKHFRPAFARFAGALQRSLPALSEAELFWRLQFMIGAMSHALCGPRPSPEGVLNDTAPPDFRPPDFENIVRRLMTFVCGGLEAPPCPEVR